MSGRGRKPANRSGGGRKTQPTPSRNAASGRSQASGSTATRDPGSRPNRAAPPAATRSGQRPAPSGKQKRTETYPFKDALRRRKRRQKVIVWIGVAGILGAVVATISLGQSGGKPSVSSAAASTSSAAAPSSAAASSSPAPSPTTAAPTGPVMAMTCPPGAGASPQFAHQITAAAEPYSITINYGDGDAYVDTNAHLAAIFSHTYKAQGTYTVTAVLTDAAQATTTATCTYTW